MPNHKLVDSLIKPWWKGVLLGLLVLASAAPWLRNHNYIRDFMDYGLVMSAVGRMETGEAPYRDFITPIQAGFLHYNRIAEKLGGGDYIGLTYGGLALIIFSMLGLTWVLAQRFHPLAAMLLAASVTVATASQHSIIWHNSLGVICLAFALWSAAIAPRWSRAQLWSHLVLGAALWIGGMNKISFHLLAGVGASGFVIRGVLLDRDAAKSAITLLGWIGVFGLALPLGTEMAVTGADFSVWHGNVMALAGSSRAEYLAELLKWKSYLQPIHDYYGPLLIPQFGLWFVVSLLGLGIWLGARNRSLLDRIMLVAAVLGCGLAANALLVTNHEIAYVAGGACIVLGVALLLAFGDPAKRVSFSLVWLILFSLLNGIPAARSAWLGERSQFGHTSDVRSDYVELAKLDASYSYLNGVLISPEMAESYSRLSDYIPAPNDQGLHSAFYATGIEWLERVWPSVKVKGLPLWMHDGTSYQTEQGELLYRLIMPPSRFDVLITSVPWDHWPGQSHVAVALFSNPEECGGWLRVYETQESLHDDNDQIKLINLFGTNFEPRMMRFDNSVFQLAENGHIFFGTFNPEPATVYLDWKGSRALARGIIRRTEPRDRSVVGAEFKIEYNIDGNWHHIETRRLELTPDQDQSTFELEFDGRQRELRFRVTIDASAIGLASAGWLAPTLLHSRPADGPPPPLMRQASTPTPTTPERVAAFNLTDWTPDDVFLRGGRVTADGYELEPGGQIWLKANQPVKALNGRISVPDRVPEGTIMPLVRVLWYKGGRVQIASQQRLNPDDRTSYFHSWSAGPEGWIGILMDPLPDVAPVTVRVEEVIPLP